MKKLLTALLLAVALAAAPVAVHAGPPVEHMISTNYIFRADSVLCSATLFSKEYRWVLTNFHCIEDSVRIMEREEVQSDGTVRSVKRVFYDEVTLSQPAYGNGTRVGELTLRAEVLAFSKEQDLAVLHILSETTPLPEPARVPADDYKLVQGQTVYGVGNPAGFENSLSRGILANLYREFKWGPDQVAHYIQTDAAIAGGSSGGSLYDEEGYLIGVPSAGYRGAALNFAIPFTVYKKFLRDRGFARAWDPTAPTREEWLKEQEAKKKATAAPEAPAPKATPPSSENRSPHKTFLKVNE